MVSLIRSVLSTYRTNVLLSIKRFTKTITMGEPCEVATGIEKREMLAYNSGNCDPFDLKVLKRGSGTKDCPNEVPSAFDHRIVGCMCNDHQVHLNYMMLEKGVAKRCECGHWFKIVQKAPV